jgi:hypothetical protein
MSKNEAEEFLEAEERKRKKEISRTVIILLVILLSPILFLAVYKLYLDHELEKEIAQIRANGYPTNFEELETWYQNGNKLPPPGRSTVFLRVSLFSEKDFPYRTVFSRCGTGREQQRTIHI